MGSRKTAGTAKNERLVRDKEDGRWDEERGRGGKELGGPKVERGWQGGNARGKEEGRWRKALVRSTDKHRMIRWEQLQEYQVNN